MTYTHKALSLILVLVFAILCGCQSSEKVDQDAGATSSDATKVSAEQKAAIKQNIISKKEDRQK